jgi:hypothetical protein
LLPSLASDPAVSAFARAAVERLLKGLASDDALSMLVRAQVQRLLPSPARRVLRRVSPEAR